MPSLEINFCYSRFPRLSVFSWYWERLQVISVTLENVTVTWTRGQLRRLNIKFKSNQVINSEELGEQ